MKTVAVLTDVRGRTHAGWISAYAYYVHGARDTGPRPIVPPNLSEEQRRLFEEEIRRMGRSPDEVLPPEKTLPPMPAALSAVDFVEWNRVQIHTLYEGERETFTATGVTFDRTGPAYLVFGAPGQPSCLVPLNHLVLKRLEIRPGASPPPSRAEHVDRLCGFIRALPFLRGG